ncbi:MULTISPECIES: XRE family transcriptional regulator [unclassified Novosphingobium]|uniref:XRE family transcriptional regulator n=1 Tax=unclassified Novosphingobium TaxID=2644732 RepID=UPI00104BEDDB|nr:MULTISPECIES: XRE family transcriptional regulator [unclassified Novosphingobium]MPS71395.1 XRE family transcriptional regulator [Novosphingobium sp.]TCM28118.1 hypothetical protein EDF59_13027 [Novosphingobium sp. ST904]
MSQPQTRREGPTRKSGNWMMRNPSTGQFVSVAHGSSKAIAMPKEIGRALSIPTDALEVVIEALRAATARSRSDGTALQFTVEVKPNGKPRIVDTAAEPVGKPASETDAELEAALAAARARGRDRVAEILAGPDMLSAEDFAKHLGTTRATINTKRVGKQVLGLQGATRGYRYPDWQIGEDGRPFAALPALFAVLGDSPWAVYRFLVQEHGELGGFTGAEALRRGQDGEVLEAAESVARAFA